MRVIFLDIDGVLNGHDWCEASQSNRIRYQCVRELNRIIAETGAKIVLSSAWRYMIHNGAMTTTGFEYLLRTHGSVGARVIGVTGKDEDTPGYDKSLPDLGGWTRGSQIREWLATWDVESYVILDDDDDFDGELRGRFVQTGPGQGLLKEDADRAISILSGNGGRFDEFSSLL